MLLDRVRVYSSKYSLLTPGQSLAVGVSGGPDSIALLHLLARLRAEYDLHLTAAHLHHGLRPEADRDAEFVVRTAGAWDVACVVEQVDVAALAKSERLSIEEAGRKARYEFFARVAPIVAVAHNADDQVETVLMHFLRGSGAAGLRGMLPISKHAQRSVISNQPIVVHPAPLRSGDYRRPSRSASLRGLSSSIPLRFASGTIVVHRPLTVIRPLLAAPRSEIEYYLAAHELEFVTDTTNADRTFFRNRLRHELIPLLERYNPNLREVLRRTAEVMAGEHELLQNLVAETWAQLVVRSPTSPDVDQHREILDSDVGSFQTVRFDLQRWRSLPHALQRALLREAIHRLRPGLRDVDFTPIEHAVRWAQTAESGHTADLLGGLCLTLAGSELHLKHWEQIPITNYELPLRVTPLPIAGVTPFLIYLFTATLLPIFSLAEIEANPDPWTAYLGADLAPFYLRTRRPGDRFQPLGMKGAMKLSDFMINRKIPVEARDTWPLLTAGEQAETILWVPGHRLAERARVGEGTQKVVRVNVSAPK